jgi:hypothetical protein
MKIQFIYGVLLAAALLMPQISPTAETGSALKNDVLRKAPYSDAQKTGDLQRGEPLQIIGKKGAWLNVKTAKTGGWVRLLAVKRGASGSVNEIKGVLAVASGRAGTGKVVATTGVRGLQEEDLKNAKYNEAEVRKLESYTQTSKQGSQFAQSGGLKPLPLDYLPSAPEEGEE